VVYNFQEERSSEALIFVGSRRREVNVPFEDGLESEQDDAGKIKVVCHGCGARYQVRDSKVRGRRFRATCKRCGGIIVAHCTSAFTVMPERGMGRGRTPQAVELAGEELHQEEDPIWYVVMSGKPHGPCTLSQVRSSFAARQINARTYLWREGDAEWRRLHEVAEFADLFGEAPTNYYGPEEEERLRVESTGETMAGGPKSRRLSEEGDSNLDPGRVPEQGGEESTNETVVHFAGEPPADEATRLHAKSGGGSWEPPAQEPWEEEQQQEWDPPQPQPQLQPQPQPWEQLPAVPRRRAMLPAPTGTSKRLDSIAPVVSPVVAPPVNQAADDHTRPLSDLEKRSAVGPGELNRPGTTLPLPELNPLPPLGPPLGLAPLGLAPALGPPLPPPPKSAFDEGLKPVGVVIAPSLHVEEDEEPTFWTTGKIAAAAAIGGGLAVAAAIVLAVMLVRPKPKVIVEAPRVLTPVIAPTKASIPSPVPPTPEVAIKVKVNAPPEEEPVASPEKAAEPEKREPVEKAVPVSKTKSAKQAKKGKTVKIAKASKSKTPKAATGGGVADDLLAAGSTPRAKKSTSPSADPDEILAAGGASGGKKPKKAAVSDDELLGGGKPAAKKVEAVAGATTLSRQQIQAAIVQILPKARSCHDKYGQSGRVDVLVVLKPNNGVPEFTIQGDFEGSPTGFCVLRALEHARFPTFTGKPISFKYPFQLN
jgi:hypothetical protein